MHDALFASRAGLGDGALFSYAKAIGVDVPAFRSCMSGDAVERVLRDADAARALRVAVTPAFYVGVSDTHETVKVQKALGGALPVEDFVAAIDMVLNQATSNAK
jgi:predicted DsbA family dithiol-disulfide isomerase